MFGFKPALDLTDPEDLAHMHRFGEALERMSPEIAIIE